MASVKIKIPAKLIVSGEHSVIYNSTAIVCAIDLFMSIEIKEIKESQIIIVDRYNDTNRSESIFLIENNQSEQLNVAGKYDARISSVLDIVNIFYKKTSAKRSGLKITIRSRIPINFGLGSSASLVSGIVFGLSELLRLKIKSNILIEIATEIENIFHGKSSGIDIQAVVGGGVTILGKESVNIKSDKISSFFENIWIIDTGRPSFTTKDVVDDVAINIGHSNDTWKQFKNTTGKIVDSIEKSDYKGFYKQIAYNQYLLESIGVVTNKTREFINSLKGEKIYAKICGAGTIASKEKTSNNGIIAIFHPLTRPQTNILKKMCRERRFNLKMVKIAKNGISMSTHRTKSK